MGVKPQGHTHHHQGQVRTRNCVLTLKQFGQQLLLLVPLDPASPECSLLHVFTPPVSALTTASPWRWKWGTHGLPTPADCFSVLLAPPALPCPLALPAPFLRPQHSQQLYRHIYLSCKEETNLQRHYEALYGLLALISIELANEEVVVDLIRLVLAVQVRTRGLGSGERTCYDQALIRALSSNC